MSKPLPLPQHGGSYTRDSKGDLKPTVVSEQKPQGKPAKED